MTNITALRPEVNEELISTVQDLLDKAKNGEIISIACISHSKDMNVNFAQVRPEGIRLTTMIGAVSFLLYKLNKDMDIND